MSLKVTDDDGDSDTRSASATVNYTWSGGGILQPINYTGPRSLFKYGSTIPVKIKLLDCDGTPASTLSPKVTYTVTSGDPPSSGELEAASTSAADTGNTMRWTGDQYIFNLNTKAITADPTVTVRIYVRVPDTDQVIYADVGLKK